MADDSSDDTSDRPGFVERYGRGGLQGLALLAALVASGASVAGVIFAWKSSEAARSAAEASREQIESAEKQAALSILPRLDQSRPPDDIFLVEIPGDRVIERRRNYPSSVLVRMVGPAVYVAMYLKNDGRDFAIIRGWEAFSARTYRPSEILRRDMLHTRELRERGEQIRIWAYYKPTSSRFDELSQQVASKGDLFFHVWYEDFHGRRYWSQFLIRWDSRQDRWVSEDNVFNRGWACCSSEA
jgi:hypothetical protein